MDRKILVVIGFAFFLMGVMTLGALFLYQPEPVAPPLPVRGSAPAFTLTDSNGQVFDSATLEGKIWVADFFFSSCGGPCPTMAKNMNMLHQRFAGRDEVRLVNTSVDPATDTPERLKQYAGKLEADTGRWHFLTGPAEEISRLVDKDGFMLASGENIINHSTRFVLVDRSGLIRGFYEGTEAAAVDLLARDIEQLLAQKPAVAASR